MLNVKYPHHPPLHSTNCSVRNQGSVASAGITSPGFPPPLSFCPFNLHSTNVVTIFVSTFVQTRVSPRTVSNRPGSVSLWTLALPPTPPPIPSQDVYQTESCTPTETLLNGGSAYGPYDINWIPLTSDPMPAALLSDPMIRLTPIFDIGAVFRIRSIHRRGLKPPSVSRYTAVTVMLLVVYIHVPLYAIHHFAPLFHSTTTSNNSSPKGKSR